LSLLSQKIEDYKLLLKFRLTLTVTITSGLAYFLASFDKMNLSGLCMLLVGGFMVTGAANALNQVLEKDFDKLMTRTANRPLAAGRMQMTEAVLIAGFMSLFGIVVLALFNPLTAFLGMLALVGYAFLYTPMKRVSPVAVVVGALPGAMPVLIGTVAVEGHISAFGLALFTIQYFWQFPHFLSIGWLAFEDYQKAGYKLIPNIGEERDPGVGRQAFFNALILVPMSFIFWWIGEASLITSGLMTIPALGYAMLGLRLYRLQNRSAALGLMFASFAYLPIVLLLLIFDKLIF
jgi:protoheme IX farnesyltransferase